MNDDLVHIVRPASEWGAQAPHTEGEAAGALVLLHDRGTDERELLPLLDQLDPLSRLTGVTLRAPLTLMPGGYQWYVVREIGVPDEPTFVNTYDVVATWLEKRLPAIAGTGLDRTVLGGFSQGAMLAYALGLGQGRPSPRALVVFNGAIPQTAGFLTLDLEGHHDIPVAIGHGVLDPVVPVEYGRSAAERLRAAGFEVTYRESTEVGHAVDADFAHSLAHWIARLSALRGEAA
jgi:phospholipase/carboxylesterase